MIKQRKIFRNAAVFLSCICILWILEGGNLTAAGAHARSEQTMSYGPSQTVFTYTLHGREQNTFYLCKYDRWFSVDSVFRDFWGQWHLGGLQIHERNLEKPIHFYWRWGPWGRNQTTAGFLLYGAVNDPAIRSVELHVTIQGEERTLVQEELFDDLFFFAEHCPEEPVFHQLIGRDASGEVIYTREFSR